MKLLVIGAGLSGLVVASARAAAGDDVVVLEARNRVGGRLWTVHGELAAGQFAELGAETMYAGQEHVLALAQRLDLKTVECGYFDTSASPMLAGGRRLDAEGRRAITDWLKHSYAANPPEPFENLEAWSSRLRAPRHVVAYLRAFAQYTPVTSLRRADAREFGHQVMHESNSYRVAGGNDLIAKRLAENLDVRLAQRVRAVDWSTRRVRVETDTDTFAADRVVVSVPGPLVAGLGFWPTLPADKVRALSELQYGTATKVVVSYAERAEVSAAVGPGCFTDGIPPWLVDQSIHQAGDAALVSSLLGGDDEPPVVDDAVLGSFDRAVSALSGAPVTRTGHLAHSWTRDEFSRVIVRAPLGDQRTRVLPSTRERLGERVFFAGEHTDDREGPGGLEGATRSGLRVAAELAEP